MEFQKIFNQQQISEKELKNNLNSYIFSQKLLRNNEKIEARILSTEEKKNILNTTFFLGNKLLFNGNNELSTKKPTGYNLRFIEINYSVIKQCNSYIEKKVA